MEVITKKYGMHHLITSLCEAVSPSKVFFVFGGIFPNVNFNNSKDSARSDYFYAVYGSSGESARHDALWRNAVGYSVQSEGIASIFVANKFLGEAVPSS